MLDTVIVIAKSPIAGRVKTRLCPPLTYEQAAAVAQAAISDTLTVTARVAATRHVLALDGPRWAGIPDDWEVVPQLSGDLDRRLVGAFAAAGPGPGLLVGMDTPQIKASQLTAFEPDRFDACLGLADDGGFWAIGFRDPGSHAQVIHGVPMSTAHTGAVQLAAMRARGLRVQMLDQLTDVDTYAEATLVAARYAHTQFAASFRSLSLPLQRVG